ncbi:MAG: hypothetical protein GEU80_14435 [Dehalococcoidia bacterium]|nr:hypothetical protein [Dehalococcoidia bacterium]
MDEYREQLRRWSLRAREVAVDWWHRSDDFLAQKWAEFREWYRLQQESRAQARAARAELEPADPISSRRLAPPVTDEFAVIIADRRDDLASITGRIDTAADVDVVLMVPRSVRALRDATVWPHIAAHVRRRGIVLRVASPRGDIRAFARANGVPAATSLRGLRRSRTHRVAVGEREFAVPGQPVRTALRAGLFGVMLFGIFFTACYTIPSATIVLVPRSEEVTESMVATLNPIVDVGDVENAIVPASSVRREIVAVIPTRTTGQAEVGDAPATVTLTITNGANSEVTLAAGTRVATEEGITFLTDAEVVLPTLETASVGATAEEPGILGNVSPGTLTLPEDVPEGVTVTNAAAGEGGTNVTVPAVAEEDVEQVRSLANEVLRLTGSRAVEDMVEEGTVFPETISVAVISEIPLSNPGDPGDVFMMEYTAVVTAIVLLEQQITDFGELMLRATLPEGEALLPGTVEASTVGGPQIRAGQVTVEVVATGQVATVFDSQAVADAVTGARPQEAVDRLAETLELQEPPVISLEPSFVPWRWLPRRASQIEIQLAAPGGVTEEDLEEEDGTATPTATPDGEATPTPDAAARWLAPGLEAPASASAASPAA